MILKLTEPKQCCEDETNVDDRLHFVYFIAWICLSRSIFASVTLVNFIGFLCWLFGIVYSLSFSCHFAAKILTFSHLCILDVM